MVARPNLGLAADRKKKEFLIANQAWVGHPSHPALPLKQQKLEWATQRLLWCPHNH
jgi:hypothetical protein